MAEIVKAPCDGIVSVKMHQMSMPTPPTPPTPPLSILSGPFLLSISVDKTEVTVNSNSNAISQGTVQMSVAIGDKVKEGDVIAVIIAPLSESA